MNEHLRKQLILPAFVVAWGLWLTASVGHAGTLTIAATGEVVAKLEILAETFEAAHAGDRVRIVVSSARGLKSQIAQLPVQLVVSDDASLMAWMHARGLVSRLTEPFVHVPLAVIAGTSTEDEIASLRDLLHRLRQQETTVAIADPQRNECGRRAKALLTGLTGRSTDDRHVVMADTCEEVALLVHRGQVRLGLLFAPDAVKAGGVTIHALTVPGVFSAVHAVAFKPGQQEHPVAQRFLAFVKTPDAQRALSQRGYELVQFQEEPATRMAFNLPVRSSMDGLR